MRKIIILACVSIMLFACTTNDKRINSKDLQGKYNLDFSARLAEFDENDLGEGMTMELATMLLSSLKLTMEFRNDKLIMDGSGLAMEMIRTFAPKSKFLPGAIDYQIREDSVLYTKNGTEDFKKVCTLRKINNSYDSLQMVVREANNKEVVFILQKLPK